jgi:putative ABC transport system permease protein
VRKVALRGLRARPVRTALTAFAVVLGVAMIAGTYVLTDTINKSFTDIFAQANAGTDVVVVPRKVDKDFSETPPPLDEALVERLRAAPGVQAAAGSVFGEVSIRDRSGDAVSGGVNFVSSLQPAPFEQFRFVSGRAPTGSGEVALDTKTFTKNGFKLGDSVTVVGDQGARRLRLVGSARFGEVASIGGYPVAIATLPLTQELSRRAGKLDTISVAGRPA